MTRLYVAGKCSGLPDFGRALFAEAAYQLRSRGFEVINPTEGEALATWADYMRRGIRQMLTCDEVVLLPNWGTSPGAAIERDLAVAIGMRVRMLSEVVG